MKISFLTIMVRDIKRSVTFYTELAGLKVKNSFNPGIGQITFLEGQDGETAIELIEPKIDVPRYKGQGLTICFSVESSLEEIHKKAMNMGYLPSEIVTEGPAPEHFTVNDPDGVCIEFAIV